MLQSPQRLKDKVIFITGASSGLGEQIAYEAAKAGATVVLAARRQATLDSVKERCAQLSGSRALSFQLDVSNPAQIEEVLFSAYQEVGYIDVLVNNAGFGFFSSALEMPQDLTEEMFKVNVLGLIQITQNVSLQMVKTKRGHIINIASQASKMATPKSAVYAATKFAVRGYSNALRLELRPFGISVTTVNTGPLRTDFFLTADRSGEYLQSVGRWALTPQDVAKPIVASMLTSKREINLPRTMEIAARLYNLFPRIGDYLARTKFARK